MTPYLESRSLDGFLLIYVLRLLLFWVFARQPFSSYQTALSRWQVIAFELAKQLGSPKTYSYFVCTRMNEGGWGEIEELENTARYSNCACLLHFILQFYDAF